MWRSSRVILKQTLSSALRHTPASPPLGFRPLSEANAGSNWLISAAKSAALFSSDAGVGGRDGPAETISITEAKKLMRLVNVEALKTKLGAEGKEVIGFSELLEACQNIGVAKSRDEAVTFARILDEAGVVLLFRDKVYLHPDKSKNNFDAPFEKLPFHGFGKELSANWGKTLGYQLISRGYLTEANRDGYKFASDSSKGPILNEIRGDEEQRITSGEVGQLNDLASLEYEGLSEAQLYKKRMGERMKIAIPVGIAPFAICNIDQTSALSVFDMSVQSSALALNLALFWHINEGIKEILADYVHQEFTREWISIFLRLFLLIVIKDLFFLV